MKPSQGEHALLRDVPLACKMTTHQTTVLATPTAHSWDGFRTQPCGLRFPDLLTHPWHIPHQVLARRFVADLIEGGATRYSAGTPTLARNAAAHIHGPSVPTTPQNRRVVAAHHNDAPQRAWGFPQNPTPYTVAEDPLL